MPKRFFTWLLNHKILVLVIYALLLIPSIYYAVQVKTDNSLDRMIVPGDEGRKIFDRFSSIFGSDEFILLGFEGKDIFSREFLTKLDEVERQLHDVPYLAHTRSLMGTFRQVNPLFNPNEPRWCERFRDFSLSTPFFNKQGLVSADRMLTIVLQLRMKTAEQRREVVRATNKILEPFEKEENSPFRTIRKVGQPYLNYEMDYSAYEIGTQFFPIYLFFAMGLVFFLYRSARGLLAVLVTLLVSLAMAVGLVEMFHSVLTLISTVMPMMVMVVVIETMIHLYSGYVRPPEGVDMHDHLIHVLDSKWKACWFSVVTTAVGFGSFVLSPVLPVRDLGLFVGISLVLCFAASFTLFPVLLDLLRPTTMRKSGNVGLQILDPILAGIPTYTYWYRKTLVPGITIIAALAINSFFSMELETNTLNYLNEENKLRIDTEFIEENLMGLLSMEIMLEGAPEQFASPDSLRKLQQFEQKVLLVPDVQSILSSSTLMRVANFIENGKDSFPRSNFDVSKYILALSQQDIWGSYISKKFDKLRISAITPEIDYHGFDRLQMSFNRMWDDFKEKNPEFKDVKITTTGMAPLMANITRHMLGTLLSSFLTTFLIVFFIFYIEIRRITYAILAMLPSLFAIMLMYLVMTTSGVKLDIGSIMIAAVVLGISVDATIHFFQHYMEKLETGATVGESLEHSLIITGRAIMVSTIVILAGFVTFTFSDFPPIKHFGSLTSVSIFFSLFGTMVYLPACLWLMNPKEKPKHLEQYDSGFRVLPPNPPQKEE